MFIAIANTITLADLENFEEFHVAIHGDVAAAVTALDGRAVASKRHNHLWIDIAFVEELASNAVDHVVDAKWQAQFVKMLAYANSKGWVDEAANRVEAHIQPLD